MSEDGAGGRLRRLFELTPTLTATCLRCGADVPDWEARTAGAERALRTDTDAGADFTVEVAEPACPCGGRRVRVRFELGEPAEPKG